MRTGSERAVVARVAGARAVPVSSRHYTRKIHDRMPHNCSVVPRYLAPMPLWLKLAPQSFTERMSHPSFAILCPQLMNCKAVDRHDIVFICTLWMLWPTDCLRCSRRASTYDLLVDLHSNCLTATFFDALYFALVSAGLRRAVIRPVTKIEPNAHTLERSDKVDHRFLWCRLVISRSDSIQ